MTGVRRWCWKRARDYRRIRSGGCDRLAEADLLGHVFAWLLWIVVIHLLPAGMLFRAFRKGTYRELTNRGRGMLTIIIKASLLASALMLLESCTGYLTNYQTPCVEGHVCECVQYTTLNRSWLDCRDYGRGKSRAY
jgi:hypothetical protein